MLQACRAAGVLQSVLASMVLLEEIRRSGGHPDQIAEWRRQRWGARAEQAFVAQRHRFLTASYYQLVLQERGEATELYHQLCNGEVDFEALLERYLPAKPGKPSKGVIRGVSMRSLPKLLAKKLRKSSPGVPLSPLMLGKSVLLVQLIEWHEPILDDAIRESLQKEIEDQWLQDELLRRLEQIQEPAPAVRLTSTPA